MDTHALDADFYLCKGALEALQDRLGVSDIRFQKGRHTMLHPARTTEVMAGDSLLGVLGEVAPGVIERLEIRGRPCIFELDVSILHSLVPKSRDYQEAPRFPSLRRDVAVVVKRELPYSEIKAAICEAGGSILEKVEVRDEYVGSHIRKDERSITISLVFRSRERTLTDEEVNSIVDSVKEALAAGFEASFRT